MELSFDHPGSYLFVRRVGPGLVTIVDRDFHSSLLLAPDQVMEDWPVTDVKAATVADMQAVLALKPEIFLLGTGETQAFPSGEIMATFLKLGIGIEAMTNAAAARTYSLLAGEGRRVVAAFVLAGT
ncbi:Mth938-like domain-containing protein [Pinirhizobacter sp.]|jgi:uncharacterized protein|uniref:Mth938-like domain-containing protein n=1 Tax=Pinirhizobacter sp. TaxID=2950432 RepID=UPI002F400B92